MKKESSIDRIIGYKSQAEREKVFQDMSEVFDIQVFDNLKNKERNKTSEELQIISFVNEITNKLREDQGLKKFDIPAQNIHVISEKKWPKRLIGGAVFSLEVQMVALREELSKIVFTKKVLHEMIHFKSYHALQSTAETNLLAKEYRMGLTITTRDGRLMFFRNLNEAVTEELTKRLLFQNSDNSLLKDEIEQTKYIIEKYDDATCRDGSALFDEDTIYATIQGGMLKKFSTKITTERFSYETERQILNTIIDKIFEKNKVSFQNREEIFEIFVNSMMTGNIISIGKLIDNTFGKGVFRNIGELGDNIQKQKKFITSL
jgi:DNA-binding transcriptional ArsR family regulator